MLNKEDAKKLAVLTAQLKNAREAFDNASAELDHAIKLYGEFTIRLIDRSRGEK